MGEPARVGLLVPSSNTVMEPDLQRALDGKATLHTARMRLDDPVTPEGELRMLDEYCIPAARDLGDTQPDVLVFGCTSAQTLRGPARAVELREELAAVTGAVVVDVLPALAAELTNLSADRVSVLTPYADELNAHVAEGLAGFTDVLWISGLGISENRETGRCPPSRIVEAAGTALAPGSDALLVVCTNFRALEARAAMEQLLGLPVVTVNSAVAAAVERALSTRAR